MPLVWVWFTTTCHTQEVSSSLITCLVVTDVSIEYDILVFKAMIFFNHIVCDNPMILFHRTRKIFYGTRTHKQIRQIAHELQRTAYASVP